MKVVKGRKDYHCCFCGDVIPKGESQCVEQITPWSHPDNEGYTVWRSHPLCWKYGLEYYDDAGDGYCPESDMNPKEFLQYVKEQEAKQ